MIVVKEWITLKTVKDGKKRVYWFGIFLFGVVPIYIRRDGDE